MWLKVLFRSFAALQSRTIACSDTGGKSGQHKAAHYLTGRLRGDLQTDSATENNRRACVVRVKMWCKRLQYALVTMCKGKPCVLKCQISGRLRIACPMSVGWQLEVLRE